MDYICRGNSSAKKQFGGILYSVVSLAGISEGKAEIYPVMNLGEDEYENVTGFLKKFKNINMGFTKRTAHKTRVVNLYYKDKDSVLNISNKRTYDREENSTLPTTPVSYSQVSGLLQSVQGILVNMVSGTDITLDTLQQIRRNFNGYIHMDLHNLVMQTFPDGTRKQFPLKDWKNWVSCTDTLQMNESEISILTGDNVTEYDTAGKILISGVNSLIITRGRAGVSHYFLDKSGGLQKEDSASVNSPEFIDSTGCGDVFASAFFFKNAESGGKEVTSALNFANKMASVNASLHGVEDLSKLKNYR
jgi:hypothetical protein